MMAIYANVLLKLLALTSQSGAEAGLATVRAADLPVYSEISRDSAVVKTLHPGDRVIVVLEITSAGRAWCRIREMDETKPSGYVMCAQLDRPQVDDQKRWNSPLPDTSSVGMSPSKQATAEGPTTQSDVRRSLRDPGYWADRFKFSEEQRQRSSDLQQDSGLAACQEHVEQMYRANGISDPASLLKALGGMGRSTSGMARAASLSAELDQCGSHYGSFWKKFVNLMDPEQKAEVGKDPYLILFLAQTLSDPATEFGFYVLLQMSKR